VEPAGLRPFMDRVLVHLNLKRRKRPAARFFSCGNTAPLLAVFNGHDQLLQFAGRNDPRSRRPFIRPSVQKTTGCVEVQWRSGRWLPPRRRPGPLGDVGPATPAIELEGDQLRELGRDVCHRIFCSTQAASRAQQGADFAESFVRRVVHNGDELVTR
jgi:hypothetical protein